MVFKLLLRRYLGTWTDNVQDREPGGPAVAAQSEARRDGKKTSVFEIVLVVHREVVADRQNSRWQKIVEISNVKDVQESTPCDEGKLYAENGTRRRNIYEAMT